MEDVKIKLAVLWLFVAISLGALIIIIYMVPGTLEDIMAGEFLDMPLDEGTLLIMALTYFWIPLVMAVSSLILKDKVNRWANIVVGAFYVAFILLELIMNLTTIMVAYGVLMDVSVIVASVLIVWFAWKWK
jgi:hypothetical protein